MGSERSSVAEQLIIAAIIAAFTGLAFRADGLPSWMLMREIPLLGLSLLGALAVHELAHAVVATILGDPTPRLDGRLTFNPLPHLHPLGTLLILLFGVGWARPVFIDSTFFRNERRGMAIAAAAGPLANLLLAVPLFGLTRMLPDLTHGLSRGLGLACVANLLVFAFNVIPIPPLDGHKVFRAMLPDRLPRVLTPIGYVSAFTLFATVLISMFDNTAGRAATYAIWTAAIVSPVILAVAIAVRLTIAAWRLSCRVVRIALDTRSSSRRGPGAKRRCQDTAFSCRRARPWSSHREPGRRRQETRCGEPRSGAIESGDRGTVGCGLRLVASDTNGSHVPDGAA